MDLSVLKRSLARNVIAANSVVPAVEKCRAGDPMPLVRLLWPGVVLDEFQVLALKALFNPKIREVFLKGNTGCGKTAIAGIAVCLYYQVWPEAKIVLTRDKLETCRRILYGEVKQWWRRMRFTICDCVLLDGSAYDPNDKHGHYIALANPQAPEGFQGVHSPGAKILHVYDEATADVLQPRYSLSKTQATDFLAMGNPRVTSGEFYRAFPVGRQNENHDFYGPSGWRQVITISGNDCMNVRKKCLRRRIAPPGGIEINGKDYKAGDDIPDDDYQAVKPIIPGQTCYDEFLELVNDPDPDFVNCYAYGRFPTADRERQLILPAWVTHSQQLHTKWSKILARARELRKEFVIRWLMRRLPLEAFGLDVAASELKGDNTVLAAGGRLGCRALHRVKRANVMQTTAWVIQTIRDVYEVDIAGGDFPICIDYGGGYGRGVGDRLEELGAHVVPFVPNATSEINSRQYANLRTEAYAELGHRMDPDAMQQAENVDEVLNAIAGLAGNPDAKPAAYDEEIEERPVFLLPEEHRLFEDLTVVERVYTSDAFRFNLTPKRSIPGKDDKIEPIEKRLGRSPDDGDAVTYMLHGCRYVKDDIGEWIEAGAFG